MELQEAKSISLFIEENADQVTKLQLEIYHLNSIENKSSFSWSRNNISPGTEFMANMMKYLKSSN